MSSHDLIERLTLGVATTLEKRPGICDVSLSNYAPAERHKIIAWEQRNTCMLPEDLKNFYLTTDGLLLTWKNKVEDSTVPLGRMEINSIADLTKISVAGSTASILNNVSLADIDYNSGSEDDSDQSSGHPRPHFDGRSRIFELDPCNGFGKVCLVYMKATPGLPAQSSEIWFLDRSLTWSFLAPDFTTYYRLMLMHLGLPQWQYAFTPVGLSPKAKEWFNLYAPVRLHLDEDLCSIATSAASNQKTPAAKVDFARVFKGKVTEKNAKIKQQTSSTGHSVNKKKQSTAPNRAVGSVKSMTGMQYGRSTKPWT